MTPAIAPATEVDLDLAETLMTSMLAASLRMLMKSDDGR
jgi:hypothetical protein